MSNTGKRTPGTNAGPCAMNTARIELRRAFGLALRAHAVVIRGDFRPHDETIAVGIECGEGRCVVLALVRTLRAFRMLRAPCVALSLAGIELGAADAAVVVGVEAFEATVVRAAMGLRGTGGRLRERQGRQEQERRGEGLDLHLDSVVVAAGAPRVVPVTPAAGRS